MHESPFTIFGPFADSVRIDFLGKDYCLFHDSDTAAALGIPLSQLASSTQPHASKTVRIHEALQGVEGADGLVTDAKSVTLTSRSADCQTFVAFDPKKNVIGVLHAGWKGVLLGAIEEWISTFKNEWRSDAKDLIIGAAPSLGKECAEFTDPKTELPGVSDGFTDGRLVDLMGIADEKLRRLGVEHFQRMPGCTKCNPETFWSYRGPDREEVRKGARNVLAITLI